MPASKLGDFELLSKLGEGAMGAVYKARQVSLDRVVALKILPRRRAADKQYIERFLREARATAKLQHANIVAGFDVGSADGYCYFAMEYIEGLTLRARIREDGRLPEKEVLRIGAAIASALAHAHQAGVIHRDVKPDNILLDRGGTPKLADLGLAKGTATEDLSLTQDGCAVGTPHYMAPEQARGESDVDGRADTYALGCTLYHAATGQVPFSGQTAAVLLTKHLTEKMPHPQSIRPDLSDEFCLVLARMVARNAADRYQSLQEAAKHLELLHAGVSAGCEPLAASKCNFLPNPNRAPTDRQKPVERAPGKVRPVAERNRRSRSLMPVVAGGIALLALVGLALALTSGGGEQQSSRPEKKAPPRKTPAAAELPKVVVAEAAVEVPGVPQVETPVPQAPRSRQAQLFDALAQNHKDALALYELGRLLEADDDAAAAAFLNRAAAEMAAKASQDPVLASKRRDALTRAKALDAYQQEYVALLTQHAADLCAITSQQHDQRTLDAAANDIVALQLSELLPKDKLPDLTQLAALNVEAKTPPPPPEKHEILAKADKIDVPELPAKVAPPAKPPEKEPPPPAASGIAADVERALKSAGWSSVSGDWKKIGSDTYEVTNGRLEAAKTNGMLRVLVHAGGKGSVKAVVRDCHSEKDFAVPYHGKGSAGKGSDNYTTGYGVTIKGDECRVYTPFTATASALVFFPYFDHAVTLTAPKTLITITVQDTEKASEMEILVNSKREKRTNYKVKRAGPFTIEVSGTMTLEAPQAAGN